MTVAFLFICVEPATGQSGQFLLYKCIIVDVVLKTWKQVFVYTWIDRFFPRVFDFLLMCGFGNLFICVADCIKCHRWSWTCIGLPQTGWRVLHFSVSCVNSWEDVKYMLCYCEEKKETDDIISDASSFSKMRCYSVSVIPSTRVKVLCLKIWTTTCKIKKKGLHAYRSVGQMTCVHIIVFIYNKTWYVVQQPAMLSNLSSP